MYIVEFSEEINDRNFTRVYEGKDAASVSRLAHADLGMAAIRLGVNTSDIEVASIRQI